LFAPFWAPEMKRSTKQVLCQSDSRKLSMKTMFYFGASFK
jgi:hypothetical protein